MRNTLPQSCSLARNLLGLILIFSVAITLPWASSARGRREPRMAQPNLPLLPVAQVVRQTNLVSDRPGLALIEDHFLVNPWGVALTANGPFWVVNNGTDVATIYQGDVSGSPFVRNSGLSLVSIPAPSPGPSPRSAPASIVANNTSDFAVPPGPAANPASFILSTELGALNAWQPNLGPSAPVVSFSSGPIYTGVAIGSNSAGNFLFAADFRNGKIDVFDRNFALTSVPGKFVDATVPSNFHPFNIQNLGGALYVTYGQSPFFGSSPGPNILPVGGGFVRRFDTNGVRDPAFAIDNGPLNAPWGIVIAPPGAGALANELLVGNVRSSFDRSSINAFDPATGAHLASLVDEGGADLRINTLWALVFGNGVNGGDPNTLYFSSGLFFERHGLFGSLKPMAAPATSLIKFSREDFFTLENSGHIDITVTRTGDLSGTATVNYATVDDFGDAQRSEYEIALGKLTFNPGETSKSFRVLIVDDNMIAGGAEGRHQLFLSNPQGAGLTSPSTAFLGIQDDEGDTPKEPPNIVDQARFFVRQHYFDFLNREPGEGGLNFWTNEITSCGTNQKCIELKRINVSAAFFLSIEFQRTGMLAYLTHTAAFGFLPRYAPFMRDIQLLQKDFVFGAPGADAQLEANKQLYFNEFIQGPEFVAKYGDLTNAQYVDTLISNTGVLFTFVERDVLVNGLNAGTETRATVLRRIAEKESFRQKEFNRAFVLMEYFGYLRRHPGRPPDFNLDGFNFWLDKLNSFNGDFVRSEMVKAFITSIEYRSRFGLP